VNLVSGAAWRLEMHAPTQATTQDWLTVITAGNTVPEQTRLSSSDDNVVAGALIGVHVLSTPRNAVVLFGADHAATATTSTTTYVVAQTAAADHVIFDMAPSPTGYAVTATASKGEQTVIVAPGGPFPLTSQGTLSFTVQTDGSVVPSPLAPTPADGGDLTTEGGTTTNGGAAINPGTIGGGMTTIGPSNDAGQGSIAPGGC
jgi:hypothetical protein